VRSSGQTRIQENARKPADPIGIVDAAIALPVRYLSSNRRDEAARTISDLGIFPANVSLELNRLDFRPKS